MPPIYPRGSEWRRWDLHVHSPLSWLNNQFPWSNNEPEWTPYVDRLETSGLSVVGVTDYFSIDGYKKLRELKDAGQLKNVTLLPNIEFRLDNLVGQKAAPRRLNLHVIFSDQVDPREIEEHFLHDLEFCFEGSSHTRDDMRKLKKSNVKDLGAKLKKEHKQFANRPDLEIGAMTAVVSHANITEVLTASHRFDGQYLIAWPEELGSEIEWDGQDHNVRKVILQKSNIVFTSNPSSINWFLGRTPYAGGSTKFVEEFGSLKPCIHGSDAHRLEEIGRPCANRSAAGHNCRTGTGCDMRYCWIKADPTFEGLKQLLYEPAERVRILSTSPAPQKSTLNLARVQFVKTKVDDELTVSSTEVALSADLVAVVGGKGAGKTAFVDLIANCFQDRANSGDKNSFVRRIADSEPALGVSIQLADGTDFKKQVTDGTFLEGAEIVYIAQGSLEQYLDEASNLDNHIKELVFESPAVADTVMSREFARLVKQGKSHARMMLELNKEVCELEARTKDEEIKNLQTQLKKSQNDLADMDEQIAQAATKLSTENAAAAQKLQEEIGGYRQRLKLLEEQDELLIEAQGFVAGDVASFNKLIRRLTANNEKLGFASELPPMEYAGIADLNELQERVANELTAVAKKVEQLTKALQGMKSDVERHAKLLDKRAQVQAQIGEAEGAIAKIGVEQQDLQNKRAERAAAMRSFLENVLAQRAKFQEIIAAFGADRDIILSDLDFLAKVVFDSDEFWARAEDVFDQRKVTLGARGADSSELSKLAMLYQDFNNAVQIDEIMKEVAAREDLKLKLKSRRASAMLDFNNFLYTSFLTVNPSVQYKKIPLSKLSLGQKATVLLKIHLARGTRPIIIDSHDDHLDNEFIMQELVQAFRQAKQLRQVILVSNNGNVVVNSDAEQVIIAERDGTALHYEVGSLEDVRIRDKLLSVLEGGEDAFRQRQRKYRLGT